MSIVALLSNPHSTGNKSILDRVRTYCDANDNVTHFEVDGIDKIGSALDEIAAINPKVIAINGGDGTVQAILTALYHGNHFGDKEPPVSVLPNGKTNLIALDLGASGEPLDALDTIIKIAQSDRFESHIVDRQLIALSNGDEKSKPVLGMFLGGAGLADAILYCRHKIYPLGLPNFISHIIATLAVLMSAIFGFESRFFPDKTKAVKISHIHDDKLQGRFNVLIVTTLEKLVLGVKSGSEASSDDGKMKLMAVDYGPLALLRMFTASLTGRLGNKNIKGVHMGQSDHIQIDGEKSSVILDGEIFIAEDNSPIVLRSTRPVPFLRIT